MQVRAQALGGIWQQYEARDPDQQCADDALGRMCCNLFLGFVEETGDLTEPAGLADRGVLVRPVSPPVARQDWLAPRSMPLAAPAGQRTAQLVVTATRATP